MIALLSATWDEIPQLKKEIITTSDPDSPGLDCLVGDLYGQSVILAVTGVGIKRARTTTSLIIQKYKPRLIIFAGFGGALSPDLKVGDIVVGESVTSLKKNEDHVLFHSFTITDADFTIGKILTESKFINRPEEKKRLCDSSGSVVVDMETWGIVEAAQQTKTPVASVRAVSDEADEHLPDMAAIFSQSGELDTTKAEVYFEANPKLLAPYLKFRFNNTPKASDSLCKFLFQLLSNL